jgi:hypothetical protein
VELKTSENVRQPLILAWDRLFSVPLKRHDESPCGGTVVDAFKIRAQRVRNSMRIKAHTVDDPDFQREWLDRETGDLPDYVRYGQESAYSVPAVASNATKILSVGRLLNIDSSSLAKVTLLGAEAADCMFAAAQGNKASLVLDGLSVSYADRPNESQLSPWYWILGFCLNLLCRRSEGLDRLARYPVETLAESSTWGPPCRVPFMKCIQAWHLGMAPLKIGPMLVEAQKQTDPKGIPYRESVEFVLSHDVYWIHLLAMLIDRDAEQFEQVLIKALEEHRNYYSSSEERRDDPDGHIALVPLALAAAAWDAGMRFDIDSEYLPMRLVTGEFLKDLPSAQSNA